MAVVSMLVEHGRSFTCTNSAANNSEPSADRDGNAAVVLDWPTPTPLLPPAMFNMNLRRSRPIVSAAAVVVGDDDELVMFAECCSQCWPLLGCASPLPPPMLVLLLLANEFKLDWNDARWPVVDNIGDAVVLLAQQVDDGVKMVVATCLAAADAVLARCSPTFCCCSCISDWPTMLDAC